MSIWDDFNEKSPLPNGLFWTAKFHSFNQRYMDLYYVITLHEKSGNEFNAVKRFGVVISEPYDCSRLLSFNETKTLIFSDLANLADFGKTNIPDSVLWKGIGQENIDKL